MPTTAPIKVATTLNGTGDTLTWVDLAAMLITAGICAKADHQASIDMVKPIFDLAEAMYQEKGRREAANEKKSC